jgi:hypothetical protein
MNRTQCILICSLATFLISVPLSASAQWEKKAYSEWTDKDALRVLNDSPWGRTQVFTTSATLFKQPTSGRQGSTNPTVANNANATHINFRVRFLSAKPVRQAIIRLLEIRQKEPANEEMAAHLKSLASGDFLEIIVVTVSVDSTEAGANMQEALSLLYKRGTADLKNNTFLEIKGGKRVFLQEYQQPKKDGLGGRFIFSRLVDGKPFITPESEEVRFYTELDSAYKLDRRFKVKDMNFEGKLEY